MSYPDLPYVGRLPVPWVTRREHETPLPLTDARWVIEKNQWQPDKKKWQLYASELTFDRHGWPWYRELTDLSGRPMWKQLHANRQRRCMDEIRCQVCSLQITGRIPWLLPEGEVMRGEPIITGHAPVCESCLPLAARMCPRISSGGWVACTVGSMQIAGVFGDLWDPYEMTPTQGNFTPLSDEFGRVIARQRTVVLEDLEPQGFPSK
jgi:hypothetical protein